MSAEVGSERWHGVQEGRQEILDGLGNVLFATAKFFTGQDDATVKANSSAVVLMVLAAFLEKQRDRLIKEATDYQAQLGPGGGN